MSKMSIPGGSSGVTRFANLALNAFLSSGDEGDKNKIRLAKSYNDDKQYLFMLGMEAPEPGSKDLGSYTVAVFNEEGKSCIFSVESDRNMQPKSLVRIRRDALSEEDKEMFDFVKTQGKEKGFDEVHREWSLADEDRPSPGGP